MLSIANSYSTCWLCKFVAHQQFHNNSKLKLKVESNAKVQDCKFNIINIIMKWTQSLKSLVLAVVWNITFSTYIFHRLYSVLYCPPILRVTSELLEILPIIKYNIWKLWICIFGWTTETIMPSVHVNNEIFVNFLEKSFNLKKFPSLRKI